MVLECRLGKRRVYTKTMAVGWRKGMAPKAGWKVEVTEERGWEEELIGFEG